MKRWQTLTTYCILKKNIFISKCTIYSHNTWFKRQFWASISTKLWVQKLLLNFLTCCDYFLFIWVDYLCRTPFMRPGGVMWTNVLSFPWSKQFWFPFPLFQPSGKTAHCRLGIWPQVQCHLWTTRLKVCLQRRPWTLAQEMHPATQQVYVNVMPALWKRTTIHAKKFQPQPLP